MKDDATDVRDGLTWKWIRGDVTPKSFFGAPDVGDGFVLCLYDGAGLQAHATIPGGGLCAGKPCWKETRTGFRYATKLRTPDGVKAIRLKEGLVPGKAAIKLAGKGVHLDVPALDALASPVTVQLVAANDSCWESVYTMPFIVQSPTEFEDTSD